VENKNGQMKCAVNINAGFLFRSFFSKQYKKQNPEDNYSLLRLVMLFKKDSDYSLSFTDMIGFAAC